MRTAPVLIALILIVTVIPLRVRPPAQISISYKVDTEDVVRNIILFIPPGIALARSGIARVSLYAMLLSVAVEAFQLLLPNRHSSPVDIITNVTGALAGALLAGKLGLRFEFVDMGRPVTRLLFFCCSLWFLTSDPFWGRSQRLLLPGAALSGLMFSGTFLSINMPKSRGIRWIVAATLGVLGGFIAFNAAPNWQRAVGALVLSLAGGLTMAFACDKSSRPVEGPGPSEQTGLDLAGISPSKQL
jgi:hypothetical protein